MHYIRTDCKWLSCWGKKKKKRPLNVKQECWARLKLSLYVSGHMLVRPGKEKSRLLNTHQTHNHVVSFTCKSLKGRRRPHQVSRVPPDPYTGYIDKTRWKQQNQCWYHCDRTVLPCAWKWKQTSQVASSPTTLGWRFSLQHNVSELRDLLHCKDSLYCKQNNAEGNRNTVKHLWCY